MHSSCLQPGPTGTARRISACGPSEPRRAAVDARDGLAAGTLLGLPAAKAVLVHVIEARGAEHNCLAAGGQADGQALHVIAGLVWGSADDRLAAGGMAGAGG